MVIPQLLSLVGILVALQAPASDSARCEVQRSSILNRTASGLPQVSNLALIDIEARVPRRPVMHNPDYGVSVEVTVYEVNPGGTRTVVRSTVQDHGGGGDPRTEWASFYIGIPLDDSERDIAIRDFLQDFSRVVAASPSATERAAGQRLLPLAQANPEVLAGMFRQHRVGRFQLECRVLDQGRLLGVARTDLEVIFKGRFFEQMLPK